MNYKKLPKPLQTVMDDLKYGSLTIQINVTGALENAEDIKEFKEDAVLCLDNLIKEAKELKEQLKILCAQETKK